MPATQYAYRQYAGNGSTTTFAVPFPYLLKAHVNVYTGYDLAAATYTSLLVSGADYTWTSATQIQATVAPAVGVTLTVIRQTPTTTQLVQWQDGSNLIASDIDTADKQNLFAVQEQLDKTEAIAAQSQAAKTSADTALSSVNDALPYASVASVAGIPATPANGARVEVLDTTGIESFTPLSDKPAGLVGSASIRARISYSSAASTWTWIDYALNDPLSYFVPQASISSSTSSTSITAVANSLAVKTAKDAADAALSKAGGTMTGSITFAAGQPTGTTSTPGIIQLTDSTNSTSITTAATPNSVKAAVDTASAALPKAGGTMTGIVTFAAAQSFPKVPQNAKTAAYTLVLSDAGKHISITTGGITVPSGIFAIGDWVRVFNNSSLSQIITQAAGVTLRLAGGALTGNRTLAPYGVCDILCYASNLFVISGTGLS